MHGCFDHGLGLRTFCFQQASIVYTQQRNPQIGRTELTKRRRKLSPEHDKKIDLFKKHVELLSAKIGDIRNDSLREEFAEGFRPVLHAWGFLRGEYDANGLTDDLLEGFGRYQSELQKFEDEYEL